MQMKSVDKRFWYILRLTLSAVILVVGVFFTFTDSYLDTRKCSKINSFKEITAIKVQKGDVIEQKLRFNMDKIHSVGICAVNRTRDCTGVVTVCIKDSNSDVLWEQNMDIAALTLEKIIWIKVLQQVETGREYKFSLSAEQMEGTLFIAGIDENLKADEMIGNVVVNDRELSDGMVFETTYSSRLSDRARVCILLWSVILIVYILGYERLFASKRRRIITLFSTIDIMAISIYFRLGMEFKESLNRIMFCGLVGVFVVVAVLYGYLLYKKNEKTEWYFIISSLFLGVVFSVILPPFSAPDEDFHFAEAYRLSNAMMGQPVNDENGYIYMRERDIQDYVLHPDNSYTIDTIKGLIRGSDRLSEKMMPSNSIRNTNAPMFIYLPQAIGITIGRLCHLNHVRLVFLGRWMNLLFFIVVTALAIRMIPYGKWIFFAICQIPLVMEVVSSYSYDVPIIAFTFLFVAYLLKLMVQDSKISLKQLLVLTLITVIYAPLKPVYLPLVALVFLIPNKNVSEVRWKSMLCKMVVMCMGVLSVLLVYKCGFMSMSGLSNEINYSQNAAMESQQDITTVLDMEETYQIENTLVYEKPNREFIMENPFDIVEKYMGCFVSLVDEFLLSLFGNYLSWYTIRIPIYISLMAMILLYYTQKCSSGNGEWVVSLNGRRWACFATAGSCFAVFLAFYFMTNTNHMAIWGIQGRYFLPLLAVLPIFVRGKDMDEESKSTEIVMFSLTIQVLAILFVCMEIWNK